MTRTLDILDRLIRYATVSASSNLQLVDYIEAYLTERGFSVTRFPDETGKKAGLYAEIGPPGRGILLSGHTDVVPTDGQAWTCDPFRLTREGGRVYGRGTTDMKGFVASVLATASDASRAKLREPLRIVLSYDEEVGCVGIRDMLDSLRPHLGEPRLCIVGEPTEMQVAVGHKGKAALRATCHGQNGHSALAPNFVNALHLAADFVSDLSTLQHDLEQCGAREANYDIPYSTVHVGKLSGGTALNIVPDRAVVDFEIRHLAADKVADLRDRVLDIAERVSNSYRARFPGARIDIEQYNGYPGFECAENDPVVASAQQLASAYGVCKVAFGTEAGYFSGLGIPTVVCGPGSMAGQGHKPNEFIEISQLALCDRMMARALDALQRHT